MSTCRGCPPRGPDLAGGISGATMAHCSSVRSEGYFLRDWSFCNIRAHSSTDGICTNYLTNILFCQALFPDSLLLAISEGRIEGWDSQYIVTLFGLAMLAGVVFVVTELRSPQPF